MKDIVSLMLHAHMPYCRKSGTWPAGEEWLFEALNETYIPLLSIFRRFQRENLKPRIMFGVVPILAEQLADNYMKEKFHMYMEDKIDRAEKDIKRFHNNPEKKKVAEYWKNVFESNLNAYHSDFHRDILGTLKWLQEEGVLEIVTSAATHGFLPLMEFDSGIYSQIEVGIRTYEKYIGKKPKGFWIPECAYRPREWSDRLQKERRSIDEWLADAGIQYFFVENIGIEQAEFIDNKYNENHPTTFRGYKLESGVSVFARNENTGKQVWSPEYGYPGDPYFREFHIKDPQSGLHYYRVSGDENSEKQVYNVDMANKQIGEQAKHFSELLLSQFNNIQSSNWSGNCPPLINSQYDCELFGHWWQEGPAWLESVYQLLLTDYSESIQCLSLSEYIDEYYDTFSTIRMKRSSWGENGDFTVWISKDHYWIWPYINDCIKQFEEVLVSIEGINRSLNNREVRILRQAGRELLLMEGSDWPFLLYTQQAREYANKRFHNHHQRFNKLLWAAKNFDEPYRIQERDLVEMEDIDNPWPNLDFNVFSKKD